MKKHNIVSKRFVLNLLVMTLIFSMVVCSNVYSANSAHTAKKLEFKARLKSFNLYRAKKAKTDANIDIVLAYFDAIDNRDASTMPELFAVDATQDFVGKDPIIGVEAIEANLALVLSQLESIETEVLNIVAEDNTVGIHVKHVAVFPPGGAFKNRDSVVPTLMVFEEATTIIWQAMATFEIESGKIIEEIIVRDELSMLMQMGPLTIDRIEVTDGIVIQNVTVVNTRDGSLFHDRAVVINAGKIQNITAATVFVSGTAQEIDASGKYLVPGFLDMHVHAMENADAPLTPWPLMISNGVTAIREMSGSEAMILRARQLNADSAAGLIDAPEVLMVHGGWLPNIIPTADGLRVMPYSPEQGAQWVRDQKAMGTDFVKLLAGSPESILAVLEEAKIQGLTVAGHLDSSLGALESSNAGWHAMEHLGAAWGVLLSCSTDEANIRSYALDNAYIYKPFLPYDYVPRRILYSAFTDVPIYQRVIDTFSEAKCQALAQAFVTNDTWQVLTLTTQRSHMLGRDPFLADPNIKYFDPAIRAYQELLSQEFEATIPDAIAETFEQFYRLEQSVTGLLQQNGVKMLTGTDSVFYGFSLHQEFRELAESGLTPLEILQMTTLNGAEFLGRKAIMGTVDVEKNADLVLLDANPLEDVANLGKIAAVFLKGKYFSRTALDKMLSDIEAVYE